MSEQHSGRYRLLISLPNEYGLDVWWENRKDFEGMLRTLVAAMDEEKSIDSAIKKVIDHIDSIWAGK